MSCWKVDEARRMVKAAPILSGRSCAARLGVLLTIRPSLRPCTSSLYVPLPSHFVPFWQLNGSVTWYSYFDLDLFIDHIRFFVSVSRLCQFCRFICICISRWNTPLLGCNVIVARVQELDLILVIWSRLYVPLPIFSLSSTFNNYRVHMIPSLLLQPFCCWYRDFWWA